MIVEHFWIHPSRLQLFLLHHINDCVLLCNMRKFFIIPLLALSSIFTFAFAQDSITPTPINNEKNAQMREERREKMMERKKEVNEKRMEKRETVLKRIDERLTRMNEMEKRIAEKRAKLLEMRSRIENAPAGSDVESRLWSGDEKM